MNVTPWPAVQEYLRPLSSLEQQTLAEGIQRLGYHGAPIYVLPDGRIIDGHHRFTILAGHAPVEVLEVTEQEGFALALAHNLHRRQLSPEQVNEVYETQRRVALKFRQDGKTQEEAAVATGVSQQTVSNWERGETRDTSNTKVGKASKTRPDRRLSVSAEDKREIAKLLKRGQTQAQLGAEFGISQQRVGQLAQQYRQRIENESKRNAIASQKAAAFGGVYDVLVIDPPWDMNKIEREVRPNQSVFDYPTRTTEQLADLDFEPLRRLPHANRKLPMKANCHVWIWTTQRFLPTTFTILKAWGLTYVCTFVWHKPGGFQPVGLPQYNCEFAVYARYGAPRFSSTKKLSLCFTAPRGRHGEKPIAFYGVVCRVTKGRRLDMFSRQKIHGFDGWGNEAV